MRRAAELRAAERRRAAELRAAERRASCVVQSVLRLVHLWSVGGSVVRRAERLVERLAERLAERRVERPSCGALEAWCGALSCVWSVRRVHLMFL